MIEMFSGDEYLELNLNKVTIPTIGYVYYLFYKEQLVYIGSTVSIDSRISAHKSSKLLDKVLYKEVEYDKMLELETSEIKKYLPIYNTKDIGRGDWNKEECSIMLEFDNYYIIRTIGHIPKEHVYIKDNRVIVNDNYQYNNNIYNLRYKEIDLNKKTITKREVFKKKDHKYSFCMDKFDFVGEYLPPIVYKQSKSKYYKSNKPIKVIIPIPEDYIFPVGKYKGKVYNQVNDNGYKNWFYENVYLNRK